MKNLILLILILVSNSISGQIYTIDWPSNNVQQKVKITIDNSNLSLLTIQKEFSNAFEGKVLDKNSLTLVGDFEKCENSNEYNLDYVKYNYFLVSFEPTVTSLYLDKLLEPGTSQGKLKFVLEGNGGVSSKPKDITYWCDCGAHSNSGPGDCVSSMDASGTIRCVSTGCSECRGTVVEHSRIISGGILIQTLKDVIGYDDQTR